MLHVFCVDVTKVDPYVVMYRMLIPQHNILIPDVAIICFRMLQMLQLFFNIFFMLQTLIFRFCGC
jgi:hypothetical protein